MMNRTEKQEAGRDTTSGGRPWRRVALVALVSGALMTLSGCHTTEGVGRDVEAAGEGLQDVAE